MQYTTNSDRSDTTAALYTAIRLETACARLAAALTSCEAARCINLASAIKRSRETSAPAARIVPKGRTLYSVKRSV